MMIYCGICKGFLSQQKPGNEDRLRLVCNDCGYIYYRNPKNVCGCLLEWEGKILLCQRAIEPRFGWWTLPAGFMENGESTLQGACRETWEEARAEGQDLQLFAVLSLPHVGQVYLIYRGVLKAGLAIPGPESSAVQLYDEEDIPWQQMAFPVISRCLELYFSDRRRGRFILHDEII